MAGDTSIPVTVEAPSPKPGFGTTEFWQGLVVIALGGFVTVYGAVVDGKENLIDLGTVLLLGQSLGYGTMRTVAKIKGA